MKINPLTAADFYKMGHYKQYPKGTEQVYSNFTARSSNHSPVPEHLRKEFGDKVIFFGLQGTIKEYLQEIWNEGFFQQPLQKVLRDYKFRMDSCLGPGAVDLEHIAALWELGHLPIEIMALPEGTRVPLRVPMFTVKNTLPEFYWVTNYLESALSAESWKACTTATISYAYKKLFEKFALLTGAPLEFVPLQGHDFSMRGMSGIHDAAKSGAGHLLSYTGTDSISAIDYLEQYYAAEGLIGGSVPASEHSIQVFDGIAGEFEYFERLLTEVCPSGIVSLVSDGFDYWKVLTEYLPQLKDKILAREGKAVIRPDSGSPADIICGEKIKEFKDTGEGIGYIKSRVEDYLRWEVVNNTPHGEPGLDIYSEVIKFQDKYYEAVIKINWNRYNKQYYYEDGTDLIRFEEVQLTPQQKGSVQLLWELFGGTTTEKGYKVLDSHIGLIYGDSITLPIAEDILRRLEKKGFASNNVVLGIGSYTFNYNTRDSYGMAMKATAGRKNGQAVEIFKDPVTDSGTKKSAKGYLKVVRNEVGELTLIDQITEEQTYDPDNEMRVVFRNGELLEEENLETIRKRLKEQ